MEEIHGRISAGLHCVFALKGIPCKRAHERRCGEKHIESEILP